MAKCPQCGKENEAGTKFCADCGTNLEVQEAPVAQPKEKAVKKANPVAPYLKKAKKALLTGEALVAQSGIPKKWIRPGAAILGLVLVLSILLSILAGASAKPEFTLYIKDGELCYTALSKFKPFEVTDRFVDTDEEVTNSTLADVGSGIGSYIAMSKDGSRLFYPDRINNDGFTLYCRNVNKPKEEPIKIVSGISRYYINESGKQVIYAKDGNLYTQDLKGNKDKLASDISSFYVSDDCKTIVYTTTDKDLYIKKGNKDKEKLDGEVTSVSFVSDDCSTILYRKDDSLYKKVGNKEKVKISSGVSSVLKVLESGELYYMTAETVTNKLSNYVTDDLKAQDEAMVEPVAPNRNDFATYDEFDQARDAYYEKRDAYNEKLDRDDLREQLKEETYEYELCKLYYYDGKESHTLSENYGNSRYSASKAAVIAFKDNGEDASVNMKLSEIEYTYQLNEKLSEAHGKNSAWFVASGKTISEIDAEDLYSMDISPDGKTIYFMDEVDYEKSIGELYQITMSGDKIKKTEKYESDVYTGNSTFVANDMYVYFMEINDDGEGELYLNKNKVDEDVRRGGISYNEESKTLIYYVDWNSEKAEGTLKAYKGSKSSVVKDDVHSYTFTAEGEVLYLYDYSQDSYRGELWLYNGKSKQIDNDVVAIVPFKL